MTRFAEGADTIGRTLLADFATGGEYLSEIPSDSVGRNVAIYATDVAGQDCVAAVLAGGLVPNP
jgi:hypothetical protein